MNKIQQESGRPHSLTMPMHQVQNQLLIVMVPLLCHQSSYLHSICFHQKYKEMLVIKTNFRQHSRIIVFYNNRISRGWCWSIMHPNFQQNFGTRDAFVCKKLHCFSKKSIIIAEYCKITHNDDDERCL